VTPITEHVGSVYAEIDLAALRHNLSVVRKHAPSVGIMAVVKSMAYGHGATQVSRALADMADALAVARIEEGLALREAGLELPIVVLEGPRGAEDLEVAFTHELELSIHHESQLPLLREYADEPIDCWLKLDTGMHRLGFPVEQAGRLFEELKSMPSVASLRVMTHLACADDLSDQATALQLQRLHDATTGMDTEFSIANSAGILAWPASHADWVRPGLMLYGASPVIGKSAAAFGLRPVMTLKAPLIAINRLQAGDAVGYGATWRAPEAMPIGVVGIGYGDGYPRHVGAGAQVLLNGQRVPVVGRVSMDMITVDLRGIEAQVGDLATLWGSGLPADEVAAWADTIAYTLFCGVTARVERRYRD